MPSVLYGPQLNITLSSGNCTVASDGLVDGKNVTCFGPSVSYSKVGGWGAGEGAPSMPLHGSPWHAAPRPIPRRLPRPAPTGAQQL
jgi:hypothetical protein